MTLSSIENPNRLLTDLSVKLGDTEVYLTPDDIKNLGQQTIALINHPIKPDSKDNNAADLNNNEEVSDVSTDH